MSVREIAKCDRCGVDERLESGNECSLERLCETDPGWAASRHRVSRARIAELEEALEDERTDHRILQEVRGPGTCQCSDDEACKFARERDEALAEVERLKNVCCELCGLKDYASDCGDDCDCGSASRCALTPPQPTPATEPGPAGEEDDNE